MLLFIGTLPSHHIFSGATLAMDEHGVSDGDVSIVESTLIVPDTWSAHRILPGAAGAKDEGGVSERAASLASNRVEHPVA